MANGKWTISIAGKATVFSSQLMIDQTQAARSLSYIPLSSLSDVNNSFINVSHTSLQNPGTHFLTFNYNWSTLPRLESAKLLMVSKGNEATMCVQLFSKTRNTAIGNELCRTGGAESLSIIEIPLADLPSGSDEIEIRSKSTAGVGHLYKAGLLLTFHGF